MYNLVLSLKNTCFVEETWKEDRVLEGMANKGFQHRYPPFHLLVINFYLHGVKRGGILGGAGLDSISFSQGSLIGKTGGYSSLYTKI